MQEDVSGFADWHGRPLTTVDKPGVKLHDDKPEEAHRDIARKSVVTSQKNDQIDDAGDGVGGEEGAFLLCSFWLIDCLALMNRRDQATALYERLLGLRNDVGLLAEEYDPVAGQQLGNFPQAFSHVAIASSAMTLCPDHAGPTEERAHR